MVGAAARRGRDHLIRRVGMSQRTPPAAPPRDVAPTSATRRAGGRDAAQVGPGAVLTPGLKTDDDKNLKRRGGRSRGEPRGQRLAPSSHRPELIRLSRDLWEPRYGRELSDEEAREILINMLGFCHVLMAWSVAEREDLDHAA